MALLEIIRQKLLDDGVASEAFPCYVNYHPESPDASMALMLTGGFPQDTLGNENLHVTFQIKVRAAKLDFATLQAKCLAVFESLQDADLSQDSIHLIQAMAAAPLTWNDDLLRCCGSYNFRAIYARNAT